MHNCFPMFYILLTPPLYFAYKMYLYIFMIRSINTIYFPKQKRLVLLMNTDCFL